jgi:hypothetical protein
VATYIVSASCKNRVVSIAVHRSETYVRDPEDINNCTDLTLVCYGKTKIADSVYATSPLREMTTNNMFGSGGTRLDIEFAIYSLMHYLHRNIYSSDLVIFAGVDFIRPMVRGAIEPIEEFELDLIMYCNHFNAMFTNTRLHCNFNQFVNSIQFNPTILSADNTAWIVTH